MKLFKSGLTAAALAVAAMGIGAGTSMADPIGGPYAGIGTVSLDGGLGGSVCRSSTIEGFTDGNSVDDLVFAGCSGAAGTPVANGLPWAVSWSGTTGSTTVDATARVFGLITCRYRGAISVTYAAAPSLTLSGTVPNSPSASGCPSSVRVTGTLAL